MPPPGVYIPAGDCVQEVAPADDAKLPPGQVVQDVAPSVLVVPTAQVRHTP